MSNLPQRLKKLVTIRHYVNFDGELLRDKRLFEKESIVGIVLSDEDSLVQAVLVQLQLH